MKILAVFPAALLAFALLSSSASADRLLPSLNEARAAARSVGWEVARRNQSVQSVKVGSCERKAGARRHCLVFARGSTSVMKTTCRIGVNVTMLNEVARGTLWQVKCRNQRVAMLRAPDALAAMQLRAQELSAGKEARAAISARASRTMLFGSAGWSPLGSIYDPQGELCAATLRAILMDDGAIRVSVDAVQCTALQPDA
jgi:hypothetical protein